MTASRWAPLVAAAACGGLAWVAPGSLAGGLAWCVTLAVAARGVGIAIERAARQRMPEVLTIVVGLAALLAVSTLAARLGLLGAHAIAGAVALSAAGNALARHSAAAREPAPGAPHAGVLVACMALAFALVVVALVQIVPILVEGTNHAFAIKHLWDLGRLPPLSHAAGLELVGEGYFALASSAQTAGPFDAACAALLIALVASELLPRRDAGADLVVLIVAIAIAMRVVPPGAWPATLLHVAAILALGAAAREDRLAWHTIVLAVALGLARTELAFLALPYTIAAFVLPLRGRRYARIAMVAGLVAAIPLQLALGGHGAVAVVGRAAALGAALPLGLLFVCLASTAELASPLGAACTAVACTALAIGTGAVPRAAHAEATAFAAWFGLVLAIFVAADDGATEPRRDAVRPGAALLALALIAASTLVPLVRVLPALRVEEPFARAVIALRDRLSAHDQRADQEAVRVLQRDIPHGAHLGFWGTSAGELDFTRNPIRDLSFAGGAPLALVPPAALRACAYVIVDGDANPKPRDPWLPRYERAHVDPLWRARDRATLLATAGRARLYRISPAPPRARRD